MRRYLFVDDNLLLAENLAEIVRDLGDDAVAADGLEAALAAVQAGRFDAVVTDMRMPVKNGAEVVHALRQLDPGLPACVMTAYTHDDDLASARREGLLAVFGKPFPVEQMLGTLAAARRGGLVALIEDDASFCDNLAELLRDRGFGVVTAHSVTETDRLGPLQPFIGLVDLRVPGGPDGEALRRFVQRFPRVPVLVVTGHAGAASPPAALRVFEKPVDLTQLLGLIEHLYDQSRSGA